MTNLDSILKSRDITLPTKVRLVKAKVFSNSPVWMWELDHKESWVPKNWCFWTVLVETTPESPLDSKEIKPVHPKGNQSWYSLEGLMLKLKLPILRPPDVKNWLIGKDLDAGKDWGQEKGVTEDEMVGWHCWLNRHESEQTLGDSGGQRNPVCSVQGVAKSRTWLRTEQQQQRREQNCLQQAIDMC